MFELYKDSQGMNVSLLWLVQTFVVIKFCRGGEKNLHTDSVTTDRIMPCIWGFFSLLFVAQPFTPQQGHAPFDPQRLMTSCFISFLSIPLKTSQDEYSKHEPTGQREVREGD